MTREGLDLSRVRGQFPGLSRKVGDDTCCFFDGPAGSQVPTRVADVVSDVLLHCNANGGGSFVTSRPSV